MSRPREPLHWGWYLGSHYHCGGLTQGAPLPLHWGVNSPTLATTWRVNPGKIGRFNFFAKLKRVPVHSLGSRGLTEFGEDATPRGRFRLMPCVYHTLSHRWLRGLTRKAFLGGLRPPVIALVGRCRGLRRPVFGVMSKISQDQHV